VVTRADQTINPQFIATSTAIYNFGGEISFAASTTQSATTSIAAATTTPISLNSIDYGFPGSDGATSSALQTDGNGALSWIPSSRLLVAEATTTAVTSSASTTLFATTIGANDLGNFGVIKGTAALTYGENHADADDSITFNLLYGNQLIASSSITTAPFAGGDGHLDFYMINDGTDQIGSFVSVAASLLGDFEEKNRITIGSKSFTVQVDETAEQLFSLDATTGGANGTVTMKSIYIELIR
jgi:hypothetical protein